LSPLCGRCCCATYRWGTNLPADIVVGASPPIEIRLAGGRGAGIAAGCFGSAKPLNIADAYADARFNAAVDKNTGYVTRSVLCIPLRILDDEAPIGVVQFINKLANTADDEHDIDSDGSSDDDEMMTMALQPEFEELTISTTTIGGPPAPTSRGAALSVPAMRRTERIEVTRFSAHDEARAEGVVSAAAQAVGWVERNDRQEEAKRKMLEAKRTTEHSRRYEGRAIDLLSR